MTRLTSTLTAALVLGAGLLVFGTRPGLAAEPKEEARRMIVMVRCTLGGAETLGAGIVVGSRSDRLYIATANHVVRRGLHEAEHLRVELRSLPGEVIEANLLWRRRSSPSRGVRSPTSATWSSPRIVPAWPGPAGPSAAAT